MIYNFFRGLSLETVSPYRISLFRVVLCLSIACENEYINLIFLSNTIIEIKSIYLLFLGLLSTIFFGLGLKGSISGWLNWLLCFEFFFHP